MRASPFEQLDLIRLLGLLCRGLDLSLLVTFVILILSLLPLGGYLFLSLSLILTLFLLGLVQQN
jgi:hypothetical protein